MKANELNRKEIIAEVNRLLKETPGRVLKKAFEPATVLIQSEETSDNSYPPKLESIDSDALCLLTVEAFEYSRKSQSPGSFYYEWQAITKCSGLYMDCAGKFYVAAISGGGLYAQFPAHPGDTCVSLEVHYTSVGFTLHDLTDSDLEELFSNLKDRLLTEASED
jgi:hypothetical protein